MGSILSHYPLAFHHLTQAYMHAIWQHQGAGGQPSPASSSSSTSSSSSSTAVTSAAAASVSAVLCLKTEPGCSVAETDDSPQASTSTKTSSAPASSSSTAVVSSTAQPTAAERERGKRTMTPAQRMREYREKLKRNPEVYQRYKQMNALRSRLARMRRSQEQVERDRLKARARNSKYRVPGPLDLNLLAFGDGSVLDFSSTGTVGSPPTHLLHEPPVPLPLATLAAQNAPGPDRLFPSTSHPTQFQEAAPTVGRVVFPSTTTTSEDWEPPITFQPPVASSP
jgi:hypothetical protein